MITMSCRISGGDFDAAGLATRRLKEQLARIGVGAAVMRRAMIASYEAEMNVVIHARTGTLWARLDSGKLDLEMADEGPGIPTCELALREGWSTASEKAREMGFGAGMGLPNIRRNSDLFDIETRVGRGTRIRSTILLDAREQRRAAPIRGGAPVPAVPRSAAANACAASSPAPRARSVCTPAGPCHPHGLCVGCAACIDECTSGVYGIARARTRSGRLARSAVLVLPRGFLLRGIPVGGAARVLAALVPRVHRGAVPGGMDGGAARRGARAAAAAGNVARFRSSRRCAPPWWRSWRAGSPP